MVRPPKPRRVVFWTENYQVGGCDKYLTDLANGINPDEWEIVFAGNPNPRMDEFVARQYAAGWPRTIVPIASVPEVQSKAAGFARTARNLVLPVRRQPRAEGESSLSGTDAHHAGALLSSLSVPVVAAVKYASRFPNRQRLGAFLQQARPDVLHINNGGYPAAESCRQIGIVARQTGVRRIIHNVNNIPQSPAWPSRVELRYDREVDRATDAWITASDFTSDRLAQVRDISRSKVHTIPNGLPAVEPTITVDRVIQREQWGVGEGQVVVAVIALFDERKGHAVLLEALKAVNDSGLGENMIAVLVGDGETKLAIEEQARDEGLARDVVFTGWLDEIESVLAAADVLVLPSTSDECLPYVIFHAMQHRLPVISTKLAGIPEQVDDGKTGILVSPGDSVELAQALKQMRDPVLRSKMGQAGWEKLRADFNPQVMVEETTKLWA